MKRRVYCILFFFLIMKVSFSQLIEKGRYFQIDRILLSIIKSNEFVVNVCSNYPSGSQSIYVLKRIKDSLLVTAYRKSANNEIEGVVSIAVNDDTLLSRKVDMLYRDVRLNNSHQAYSKELLTGGYFFLSFYKENKLQLFYNKKSSQKQKEMMSEIFRHLQGLSVSPFGGVNPRKKDLNIKEWNALLKYLKTGIINSQPK